MREKNEIMTDFTTPATFFCRLALLWLMFLLGSLLKFLTLSSSRVIRIPSALLSSHYHSCPTPTFQS